MFEFKEVKEIYFSKLENDELEGNDLLNCWGKYEWKGFDIKENFDFFD